MRIPLCFGFAALLVLGAYGRSQGQAPTPPAPAAGLFNLQGVSAAATASLTHLLNAPAGDSTRRQIENALEVAAEAPPPPPAATPTPPTPSPGLLEVSLAYDDSPIEFTLDPGTYRVRLLDRLPNHRYRINNSPVIVNVDPLKDDLPLLAKKAAKEAAKGAAPNATLKSALDRDAVFDTLMENAAWFGDAVTTFQAEVTSKCDDLDAALRAALEADTEPKLGALLPPLRRARAGSCNLAELTSAADSFLAATEQEITPPATITASRGVQYVVARDSEDWEIDVVPPRNRVFLSYGFNAYDNPDEEYFTRTTTGADGKSSFTIERKRDDAEDYDLVPGVALTYLFADRMLGETGPWGVGLTFGAGAEGESIKPALSLGLTLTLSDNFFLTFGQMLHSQKRLLGELSEGPVPASLTEDQLHRDTWDWSTFFGLTFRIDRPSGGAEKPKETKKQEGG